MKARRAKEGEPGPERRIAELEAENARLREAADKALRRSEARLARALEAGRMGDWEWNLKTGEVIRSENLLGVLNLPPDLPHDIEAAIELIHPDDRERVQETIEAAVAGDGSFDMRYRILDREGATRRAREAG
ncbi:MAG: PAS domain-containing protein [Sphingomonadaceae bacterium]